MGWVVNLLWDAYQFGTELGSWLSGKNQNDPRVGILFTAHEVSQTNSAINQFVNAVTYILQTYLEQNQILDNWANTYGTHLPNVVHDVWSTINHVVDVIIPASIHHVEGKIVSEHIGPLRSKVVGIDRKLTRVDGNERKLSGYVHGYVDKWIGNVRALIGWFGHAGKPYPTLPYGKGADWVAGFAGAWTSQTGFPDQLLARQAAPGGFAYSRVVAWLNDGAHQGARDDLLQVLIDYSPERFRHVVTAAEQILNQPIADSDIATWGPGGGG